MSSTTTAFPSTQPALRMKVCSNLTCSFGFSNATQVELTGTHSVGAFSSPNPFATYGN